MLAEVLLSHGGNLTFYSTLTPAAKSWDKEVSSILTFLNKCAGTDPLESPPTGAALGTKLGPSAQRAAASMRVWVEKMTAHYQRRIRTLLQHVPAGLEKRAEFYARVAARLGVTL